MARFNMMDRLLHSSQFEDFFAAWTGGTSGHDHLNGTTTGNVLFAGRGGAPTLSPAWLATTCSAAAAATTRSGVARATTSYRAVTARISWLAVSALTGWMGETATTSCSAGLMPERWWRPRMARRRFSQTKRLRLLR